MNEQKKKKKLSYYVGSMGFGVLYEPVVQNETNQEAYNRKRRNTKRIKTQELKFCQTGCDTKIPDPPPSVGNPIFDRALDCIRSFELEQMSYKFSVCSIFLCTRDVNECRNCYSNIRIGYSNIFEYSNDIHIYVQ